MSELVYWVYREMSMRLIRTASFNCISFKCPKQLFVCFLLDVRNVSFSCVVTVLCSILLLQSSGLKYLQPPTVLNAAWTFWPFPSLSPSSARIVNGAGHEWFSPDYHLIWFITRKFSTYAGARGTQKDRSAATRIKKKKKKSRNRKGITPVIKPHVKSLQNISFL